MKKMTKNQSLVALFCIAAVAVFCGCSGDVKKTTPKETPLNVSVYLDLSNRLVRSDGVPSTTERDTAIVNHLVEAFVDSCVGGTKLLKTENHFQVFLYPHPGVNGVANLVKSLNVDLKGMNPKDKKKALLGMKARFAKNLSEIYSQTVKEQKWIGSDIWGFFDNKRVDSYCIRKGNRNVLIIITDGYIDYSGNKLSDGNGGYSYLTPKTLTDPKFRLLSTRKGLGDLEVLMLEVYPYNVNDRIKMLSALEKWFKDMGVKRFVCAETDLPVNTETVIDNFLEN